MMIMIVEEGNVSKTSGSYEGSEGDSYSNRAAPRHGRNETLTQSGPLSDYVAGADRAREVFAEDLQSFGNQLDRISEELVLPAGRL